MSAAARIAFIDLEASSLNAGSFPIECGWAIVGGESGSVLVRPDPEWLEAGSWDPVSEEIHKIPLATLMAAGVPAPEAARQVLAALDGCEVWSDAPAFDAFWVGELFSTAGYGPDRPAPLRLQDAGLLWVRTMDRIRVPRHMRGHVLEQAERLASEQAPRTHRAEADARHLRAVYEALIRGAGQP